MKDFIFWDMDERKRCVTGKEWETFVDAYEPLYFRSGNRSLCGLRRSSPFAEGEITRILNVGFGSTDDVKKVLAWKVGRINHSKSEKSIIFTSEWRDPCPRTYRGRAFGFRAVADKVMDVEKLGLTDPDCIIYKLNEAQAAGVGPVYLLTLLYFLTKGRYPIYDQYAAKAISSLCQGIRPAPLDDRGRPMLIGGDFRKKVELRKLPTDTRRLLEEGGAYLSFKEKIERVFGSEILADAEGYRRIDRALWVYGHRFRLMGEACCHE